MISNFARRFISVERHLIYVRNKATNPNLNEKDIEVLTASESIDVYNEEEQLRLEELEKKRNKSRLYEQHYNIVNNSIPYKEPVTDFHKTVAYQRKMYGRYGNESGVDPGICWPTKEEIQEIKEYEKVAFPYTIQEIMEKNATKRREQEEQRQQRQNEIVKKYAKLEQWKKDLKDRVAKKEAEALAVKQRKDRLVEEVRRHFGFKIDPRDERFKEMLEQKERAEKKAMKEAKRKMKEAKLVAKLQEKKVPREPTNTEIQESESDEKIENLDNEKLKGKS